MMWIVIYSGRMDCIRIVEHNVSSFVACHQPPPPERVRILSWSIGKQPRRQHVLIKGVLCFLFRKAALYCLSIEVRFDFSPKRMA
jgi:hypothetical protein